MAISNQEKGYSFEEWCAALLRVAGFHDVKVTQRSKDYGVDVIACLDGEKYAVQCKNYTGKVGIDAVQAINAGKAYWDCDKAMVITTSTFTRNAIDLAVKCDVTLWDKYYINDLLGEVSISYHQKAETDDLKEHNRITQKQLIESAKKCAELLRLAGYQKVTIHDDVAPGKSVFILAFSNSESYVFKLILDAREFTESELRETFTIANHIECDNMVVVSYSAFAPIIVEKSKNYNIVLWDKPRRLHKSGTLY